MKYLLSCDWGTSSFRLRLVEWSSGRVLGEQVQPSGIAKTFDAWKLAQRQSGIEREAFFCQFLQTQIHDLAQKLTVSLVGVPIVLSGMASSSIGLAELPYAHLPFALNGTEVSVRWFESQTQFEHRLLLISGVRGHRDVMRGEETQLIGLSELLAETEQYALIFPGTHSKHMFVKGGQLIDFQTFMTGELFDALVNHTILKQSTDPADLAGRLNRESDWFAKGVEESASGNLLHSLFTVRTNQLLGGFAKPQNALYLSGLLIGKELRPLLEKTDWKLVLCCDNNLVHFYELAITVLGLSGRTTRIDANRIRHAAIAGHLKIMHHQLAPADTLS